MRKRRYTDPLLAYLAGDYEALHYLELRKASIDEDDEIIPDAKTGE